jgi:DNA polymerase-3 subunit alpha
MVHEEAVDAVTGLKREQERGQYDLFGGDGSAPAPPESSPLAHLKFGPQEYPRKQLLAYEREMLGLYVSAHPLEGAERILRKHAPKPLAALMDEAPTEGEIVLAGMIVSVDKRVNKNGESWAIVTLEDLDASMEVLFFAKTYAMLSEDLIPDTAVAIQGRVNWRDDKMSVFGSAVIPLDISAAENNPGGAPPFVLRVEASQLDQETAIELRSALVANKGDTRLHILLCHGARKTEIAIEDYPVTVSSALLGELKSIRGITVAV